MASLPAGSANGTITAATASPTTVATLTAGSFIAAQSPSGFGATTFSLQGSYTGQFSVWVSTDGVNLSQVSSSLVVSSLGVAGLAANADGTFMVGTPNGAVFLIATSLSAGTPAATMNIGSLTAGGAAGGEVTPGSDVNLTGINGVAPGVGNPLPTQDINGGVQGTGLNPPSGGSGFLGFLSGIYSRLGGTLATSAAATSYVDGSIVAIGTTTQTKATDGSATSWSVIQLLKGIFDTLLNSLSVGLKAGSNVIGKVSIDQTTPGTTNNVSVSGQYNVTPPTLTNAQWNPAQLDSQSDIKMYIASLLYGEDATNNVLGVVPKLIIASTYAVSTDIQAATVSHTSKGTAGLLVGVYGSNTSASLVYLQVWGGSSVNTGTLLESIPIPAGSATVPGIGRTTIEDYGNTGVYGSAGISWGFSTTAATYTAVGAGTGLLARVSYK